MRKASARNRAGIFSPATGKRSSRRWASSASMSRSGRTIPTFSSWEMTAPVCGRKCWGFRKLKISRRAFGRSWMMRTSRNRRRARLLSAILPGMCALAFGAEEPAPSERSAAIARGRQIYLTGVPLNGAPLTASVGDPAMEVPASILKCSNCHGNDGRGKAEGGVSPANIRWEELTKASASEPAGRRRSAYSGKLLVRAIALGIDASGNRLDQAMPRYRLTQEQAADLVAYLEEIGREADPGVT